MDNYFKKKGQIVKKIKMNTPIQLCFCNDSYASTVIEAMILRRRSLLLYVPYFLFGQIQKIAIKINSKFKNQMTTDHHPKD